MSRPSKKGRVTIQDVAAHAGVAKATVSHAISGKRPVASQTRERIFAAMRELDFRPNLIARRLAGGASHTIALIYPLASATLSAVELRFISSIADVVNRTGYSFLALSSPHVELGALHSLIGCGLVDGVILMRIYLLDARMDLLKHENIPFVMIGRAAENHDVAFVDLDSAKAMEDVVDHLVQLGHRRIGFVCPDDQDFGFAFRLVQAYQQTCGKHGLPILAEPASMSDEAGYWAMCELLKRDAELTGVIVWSDVVTSGVMRTLNERQRAVPDDISVASFDRSAQLRLVSSDLTVIDTRAEEVGAQAASMLLDMLSGRTLEQQQVLIAPKLLLGESTAPARRNGRMLEYS